MIKYSYVIQNIPLDIIQYAIQDSKNKSNARTSNTVANGSVAGKFFYKKLNVEKIRSLYKGSYIQLWKDNYEILRRIIPLNDIYGIIETKDGNMYEFSQSISNEKFLSGGTTHHWDDIEALYVKVLNYINKTIEYQKNNKDLIGVETAIWNFTIDGKLFDLDPPRLLRNGEDTSFTKKNDIDQAKRTIYRNFTEIGMKTNLLATVIIGFKDGNFLIPDLPKDYIDILLTHLINSIEDNSIRKAVEDIFNGKTEFHPSFAKHPIDIILKEKNKLKIGGKKMTREPEKQKFIFVTGPSESGKSGGINHIKAKYPQVKHLKIRDIFPAIYRETDTELPYDEWYNNESRSNFESFWDRYIQKAKEMSEGSEIVIMDTMYGVKEIQYLYKILQQRLGVLYIDADEQKRIEREYVRLRNDSPYSDRKADLSITMEQVQERTRRKDDKKRRLETFEYKDLAYERDGTIVVRPNGIKFSTVIANNGTVEEFYKNLDLYIESEISKIRSINSRERKER